MSQSLDRDRRGARRAAIGRLLGVDREPWRLRRRRTTGGVRRASRSTSSTTEAHGSARRRATPARPAQAFEEVERQHPYSQWATRAQLMSAYAFYEANDYDEAVAAAQRFIDLHPGHEDVAYAYYLIGVSLLRADLRRRPRPEDDRAGARAPSTS